MEDWEQKLDETHHQVKQLYNFLYGKDGFEGDIPEIKRKLEQHNKLDGRVSKLEGKLKVILITLTGSALGGGGYGLFQLMG